MIMMKHGSLFSGIGGFDLASEWMGWDNVFHCEWDAYCQRILKYYWPKSKTYGNIDDTDFTEWRGIIDVLTGGFPCQPYSTSGKRKGDQDNRHKWPQMLRAIREIQPRWLVGENVRGLTNWNGGMVFDEVQADLETEGYEVLPFLLPACGVEAPHERFRIWPIAYAHGNGDNQNAGLGSNTSETGKGQIIKEERQRFQYGINGANEAELIANAGFQRLQRCDGTQPAIRFKQGDWSNWPTVEPSISLGNDGISRELDGITFSKWKEQSIKGSGNAIVPQEAYQIFKAIQQYENTLP